MIEPRADGRYDMRVGDEGDQFVNSNQGYENAEDCIAIARRLWPPIALPAHGDPVHAPEVDYSRTDRTVITGVVDIPLKYATATVDLLRMKAEPVVMRVTYRTGKTHTEQLR